MRRRLLILAITLTAAVLTALIAPLVTAYAEERAVTLHEQRLAAATRFAALVDDSASGAPALLGPDLARYDAVTGSTRSAVIGPDGSTLAFGAAPSDARSVASPGYDDAVQRALTGTPTTAPSALWPWRTDPLIVATPIGRDAQILGAVVMVVDTAGPRGDVATRLAVAVAVGIALLALVAFLVGVPLVAWVVRGRWTSSPNGCRRSRAAVVRARRSTPGHPSCAAWPRPSTRWPAPSSTHEASSAT